MRCEGSRAEMFKHIREQVHIAFQIDVMIHSCRGEVKSIKLEA